MTYKETAYSIESEKQSTVTQSTVKVLNPNVKKFDTVDGKSLMEQELTPIKYIVLDFLSQGLHILAGSPKTGKSWLVLWLCLQISKGEGV